MTRNEWLYPIRNIFRLTRAIIETMVHLILQSNSFPLQAFHVQVGNGAFTHFQTPNLFIQFVMICHQRTKSGIIAHQFINLLALIRKFVMDTVPDMVT